MHVAAGCRLRHEDAQDASIERRPDVASVALALWPRLRPKPDTADCIRSGRLEARDLGEQSPLRGQFSSGLEPEALFATLSKRVGVGLGAAG